MCCSYTIDADLCHMIGQRAGGVRVRATEERHERKKAVTLQPGAHISSSLCSSFFSFPQEGIPPFIQSKHAKNIQWNYFDRFIIIIIIFID